MRYWRQLAFRTWRQRPGRTLGAILAIAMGVAVVVWISSCYESARQWVTDLVYGWVGQTHIYVRSPLGKWGTLPDRCVPELRKLKEVKYLTEVLRHPIAKGIKAIEGMDPAAVAELVPQRVEAFGIDPENEPYFRSPKLVAGRYLQPGDTRQLVMETGLAELMDVHLGDKFLLYPQMGGAPVPFDVVGIIEKRRIGRFQFGVVYVPINEVRELRSVPNQFTTVDIILYDGSIPSLQRTEVLIRNLLRRMDYGRAIEVASAVERLKQMQAAQKHFQDILLRISGCALLTSFFVILTTLTVGVIERITQLGLMRCIALTRMQLVGLIMLEVVPMGAIGIVLGIPLGIGLTVLTVYTLPDYFSIYSLAISRPGIWMGVFAGAVATLMGVLVWPAPKALLVSPLEASRPRARSRRRWGETVAAGGGVVLIIQQIWVIHAFPLENPYFLVITTVSMLVAFIGYALIAPAVIVVIGQWLLAGVAMLMRIRPRVMRDQVALAPWRSAGICCGLMVGLALIVALLVHAESVIHGWRFPREFPEAYVWCWYAVDEKKLDDVKKVKGVKSVSAFGEFGCMIGRTYTGWRRFMNALTRFVAVDPDSWPDVIKVEFIEGNLEEAQAMLRRGGHVLVAEEFSNTQEKHLGDSVTIRVQGQQHTFKVAGVVTSTAIEIAASFFEAEAELQVACVGSVVGTIEDAKRYFNVGGVKMFLLNFDLPAEPVPPDFPDPGRYALPEASEGEFEFGLPIGKLSRQDQWQRYRETRVLTEVKETIEDTHAWSGSVRELKKRIDQEIRTMTHIISVIPAFFLVIAGIGVLNLMMSNVASRSRELALLRAVGMTEFQILRMVIGEALVLGLLSGLIGLPLGIQLAHASNVFTERMFAYRPELAIPWDWVVGTMVLTVSICLVAGLWPAHRASRSNVIEALAS
ncbi:MAG: FtsX-like permease family protein [Phycisphaerae bacterium]|nr:FtsX-like permease family protein [Phycisphaerae bacterium]